MFATLVVAEVIKLTDAGFEEHLKQNPLTLVKFYAPWCGHCKALAPKWEELAKVSDLPVAEIDCTEQSKTCGKYGVNGYPSVKMLGKDITYEYDGARETDDINKWSKTMREPMFTVTTSDAVKSDKNHFIVSGAEEDTLKYEGMLTSYKGKLDFYYVVGEPKLTAVRNGEELTLTDLTPSAIKMFVEVNKVDFFPDLRQNYQGMVNRPGKQLLVVCLSSEYHSQMVEDLKKLDKSKALKQDDAAFLEKYTLAQADVKDMAQFCDQFESPEGDVPFVAFFQGKNEKSKKYAKVLLDGKNVVEELKAAVSRWEAGSLTKAWIEDEEKKKEKKEKQEKKEAEAPKSESKAGVNKELLEELKKYIDEKVKSLATKKDLEEAIKKL